MRIAFASLGSLGDLHPLLALAAVCRERGHGAVIAASESFRPYVESLGFPFHRIRPDLELVPSSVRHLSHPRRGPERLLREEVFPRVRETHEDLVEAARGADLLVVGELLYVAPLVAAELGIPWANVILSPSSFLSACDPCVLAPVPAFHGLRHLGPWPHRVIFALGRLVTSRWGKPLSALRRELGFPAGPSPVFEGKHSPQLVLTLFPEFLAAPQPDWPRAVVQTGFPYFPQPVRPETREKLDRFLTAGEPPVVFTLGSTAVHIGRDFYQSAAAAARSVGCRAVLLAGKNPHPAADPDILVLDYVPLGAILPRAVAVVHHGGIGSCAEALRAGRPSLIVPFGYDQPDNAERLRRLGVARILRRNRVSTEILTAGLREVLGDPGLETRARELSRRIRPEADLSCSMDFLERLGRASLTASEC